MGIFWTSGEASEEPKHRGFEYHGKFYDGIGFRGWTGGLRLYNNGAGATVLSFVHDYYAATKSVDVNKPGIFVGSYQARTWTDFTTHTKR